MWLERRFSQRVPTIRVERHVYTGAQVDDDVAIAKRPHRPVAEKNTSSSRRPPVRGGKQKNNTDQALSGRRITRPSLSQATESKYGLSRAVANYGLSRVGDKHPTFSTVSIKYQQINSFNQSLPITVTHSEICVYAAMFVNIA